MNNERIAEILKAHSIGFVVENGSIYGIAVYTDINGYPYCEKEEMTGWSRRQLYDWLGY